MCCERYQSEVLWVKLQALNTALADQTRTSKPGTTPQAAAQTMYPPRTYYVAMCFTTLLPSL